MQFTPQQRKKIIIVSIVVLAIIVVASSMWAVQSNSHVTLKVVVAPQDATLTIDGQSARPGDVSFTKTKHTLKATRKDFADASVDIDASKMKNGDTVYVVPDPNTDAAKKYLLDHPDDQYILQRKTGQDVSAFQSKLDETYPIIRYLPKETLDYKVDYKADAAGKVTFQVTLFPAYETPDNHTQVAAQIEAYKKEALDFMSGQGVDVHKETITFTQE
jgi:type 1 fimbria pilin